MKVAVISACVAACFSAVVLNPPIRLLFEMITLAAVLTLLIILLCAAIVRASRAVHRAWQPEIVIKSAIAPTTVTLPPVSAERLDDMAVMRGPIVAAPRPQVADRTLARFNPAAAEGWPRYPSQA